MVNHMSNAPTERDHCPGLVPRLWVYTNYDCNLTCSYCVAMSGPRVERRGLSMPIFRRVIDEASEYGIREVFLTGGEPFILPDIGDRIRYAAEAPPVLSARIQDLYGLEQMHTIALGRQPLVVEILAPNQRPVQVTQDLAGFWKNTYPALKKTLQKRYPKHEWR